MKLTKSEIYPSSLNKNPGRSGIAINKKQPMLSLHLLRVIHPTTTINKLKVKPEVIIQVNNGFVFIS